MRRVHTTNALTIERCIHLIKAVPHDDGRRSCCVGVVLRCDGGCGVCSVWSPCPCPSDAVSRVSAVCAPLVLPPCIGMSDLVVRPMFSRCYIFSRAFDGAAWPVSSPGWCTDSQLESMFSWRGVGLFVVLYRSVVESNFGRYCQCSQVRLIARVGTYQFH